jgi:uncharacterized protein (TIGR04255 family)
MRLRFLNQPLNEVALNHSCAETVDFSPDIVYEIAKIADTEGWRIEKSDVTYISPGLPIEAVSIRAPQFKLVDPSGVSIVFQSNLVRVQWSKASGQPYPHFESLVKAASLAQSWYKAVAGEFRPVSVVNVVYTNYIEVTHEAEFRDLISPGFVPKIKEGMLRDFSLGWSEEQIDLRIQIMQVEPTAQHTKTYILSTVAGTNLESSDSESSSLKLNLKLNAMFGELITDKARLDWKQEI